MSDNDGDAEVLTTGELLGEPELVTESVGELTIAEVFGETDGALLGELTTPEVTGVELLVGNDSLLLADAEDTILELADGDPAELDAEAVNDALTELDAEGTTELEGDGGIDTVGVSVGDIEGLIKAQGAAIDLISILLLSKKTPAL